MATTSCVGRPQPSTIHETAIALANGSLTATALCQQLVDRHRDVDPLVCGFVTLDIDDVMDQAAASDQRRSEGAARSAVDGIPVAVKDNISVRGQSCGCASRILEGYTAAYDATVVQRMRDAGIICFGRTNMDEFAMGSSTENSALRPTRNPCHLDHVPGGSSGGSAAVVASGQTMAALGSDTGGSIRQPASFCGAVGFKPTYGRVSRYGLTAFASSLDQIGPITQDVRDTAILFDIIGGADHRDSTSLPEPCTGFAAGLDEFDVTGLRVGIPREFYEVEGLSSGVQTRVEAAVDRYRQAGAEIVDVSLPNTRFAVAAYYVVATAEASSNLARFDGVRYGRRAADVEQVLDVYLNTRAQGFGAEVKRRIILGTYVLSEGYSDQYYVRAQKIRSLIRRDYDAAFNTCDVIISPVAPTTAFAVGEIADPLQMYLADIYTIPVNLAGNCAISVPAGVGDDNLPIGIQLIGGALQEMRLLQAANWLFHSFNS